MEDLKLDTNRKNLTKKEQDRIIAKVKYSFVCEGMPLTEEDIQDAYDVLSGRKTGDEVNNEKIAQFKAQGLIK